MRTALARDDDDPFIRPYLLTGGRTAASVPIEALVWATGDEDGLMARRRRLSPEHERILEVCRTRQAVAEVAAHLSLPLGVVRVLVGDLDALGLVIVSSVIGDGRDDIVMVERLLDGVRRLAASPAPNRPAPTSSAAASPAAASPAPNSPAPNNPAPTGPAPNSPAAKSTRPR
jgi:Protein of unknown function (DUF742)